MIQSNKSSENISFYLRHCFIPSTHWELKHYF